MTADLEKRILDEIASMQAERGTDAAQSDIRVRLLPPPAADAARHAFDHTVAALTPKFVMRDGLPATPMLRLTVEGWLRSSSRPAVERLVQVFLETYRALAQQGQLHGRHICWEDLVASGMTLDLFGLLSTAASELHLFAGGTLPVGSRNGSMVNLELPWDVGELVHVSTVADFLEYRKNNSALRVNFFQRLQLRVTGEIRRVVVAIYDRSVTGWPSQRKVDVMLRRNGDSLANAVNAGFAFVIGADDLHARVGLTYHGLWLLERADVERNLILKVLHTLAKAYSAAPLRTQINAKALVEAGAIDEMELAQVLALLEGQVPAVVVPGSTERTASFFLGPWLLELRGANTFEDAVFALGRAAQAARAASVSGSTAGESAPVSAHTEPTHLQRGRGVDAWADTSGHAGTDDASKTDTQTTNDLNNVDASPTAAAVHDDADPAHSAIDAAIAEARREAGAHNMNVTKDPDSDAQRMRTPSEPSNLDPTKGWLAATIRSVTALRYVQAVTAIAALFALARSFVGGSVQNIVGVVLAMIGLGIVVFIFKQYVERAKGNLPLEVKIIVGVVVALVSISAVFATTSLWLGWPRDWRDTKESQRLREDVASNKPKSETAQQDYDPVQARMVSIDRMPLRHAAGVRVVQFEIFPPKTFFVRRDDERVCAESFVDHEIQGGTRVPSYQLPAVPNGILLGSRSLQPVFLVTITNDSEDDVTFTHALYSVFVASQVAGGVSGPVQGAQRYKHELLWGVGLQEAALTPVFVVAKHDTAAFELELFTASGGSDGTGAGICMVLRTSFVTSRNQRVDTGDCQIVFSRASPK